MLNVDISAHHVFETPLTRRNNGRKCIFCGHPLQTAYHEERLYSVLCPECGIVLLVKAGNPGFAEDAIGKLDD